MTEHTQTLRKENPLGVDPVKDLLLKFAIPSIIAMLVSSLYNIVDQFFIGNSVGTLGNAATNIAFPLSTSCIAISLLLGIGGAAAFNIAMGEKKEEEAAYLLGNALSLLFLCGLVLCIITRCFLSPLLVFFGSPAEVLPYAETYVGITSFGFPFLIVSVGGGHLVRADGCPSATMTFNLVGAVINMILDPLFIFGFHMGMTGAALATIIGQFVSAILVFRYMSNCRSITLKREHLLPKPAYAGRVITLGTAPFFNQISMMVVQVVMNKSLTYYGSMSIYGESIPLACSGIINKVGMLFFSVIIGISQGLQPIASFNYGAKKYTRVRESYRLAITAGFVISVGSFLVFQIFPRQIIGAFGKGSKLYYSFAVQYFRIFLFFTFLNCIQPISSNFFTAIGKPRKGIFLSLTRQIIFLLPLIIALPLVMGIDGIMFAGPTADGLAAVIAALMARSELKKIRQLEQG